MSGKAIRLIESHTHILRTKARASGRCQRHRRGARSNSHTVYCNSVRMANLRTACLHETWMIPLATESIAEVINAANRIRWELLSTLLRWEAHSIRQRTGQFRGAISYSDNPIPASSGIRSLPGPPTFRQVFPLAGCRVLPLYPGSGHAARQFFSAIAAMLLPRSAVIGKQPRRPRFLDVLPHLPLASLQQFRDLNVRYPEAE
jgi:hypothetical protein